MEPVALDIAAVIATVAAVMLVENRVVGCTFGVAPECAGYSGTVCRCQRTGLDRNLIAKELLPGLRGIVFSSCHLRLI